MGGSVSTSRRELFGSSAALLLLAAPAAGAEKAAELDGALIRMCDDFTFRNQAWGVLLRQIDAMPQGAAQDALQAQADALSGGYRERRMEIADIRARTPEGMQAKARAAAAECDDDPPPDCDIMWSLVNDLLGRT
jgi:hypothetical protein